MSRYFARAALAAFVLAACATSACAGADAEPQKIRGVQGTSVKQPNKDEYLVGVYYFAGWWREQPNKWFTAGRDWRPDYPGRVPLLGEYNEQDTMDKEIAAAAKYGVDFFQILWYPLDPERRPDPHLDKLNEGLRLFMASPNSKLMKFTIEAVNHGSFSTPTDEAWESACREWCAAMKHPSYLRVGGRPVFKVHTIDGFLEQNSRDQARVEKRLETLRRIARDNGLPDLLIGGGVYSGGVDRVAAAPYDFLSSYMEVPGLPKQDKPYPYESLLKHAEDLWQRYAEASEKPYVPYVPAGWDPRPWKDPRASFELPGRDDWANALKRVKAALDGSRKLGIPTPGGRQKALLIYAWNEFAEGGIVAPTKGDGMMKLEVIKKVFGKR